MSQIFLGMKCEEPRGRLGQSCKITIPLENRSASAKKVADETLGWATTNKKTDAEALNMFDRSFTPFYIGQIWTGTKENIAYFYKSGGGVPTSKRLPDDYGQQDFKDEFLDANATRFQPATDNWGEPVFNFEADQVHHFVGHFSAGINGAYLSSSAQQLQDYWGDNAGDTALTTAAYAIGRNLANNPKEMLKSIGQTIRSKICR